MTPTPVRIWGRALTPDQEDFLERFCPILDRAGQEVAFRWGLSDPSTKVYPGPGSGVSVEVRQGSGPGGLLGRHDAEGCVVWDGMLGLNGLARAISHELFEYMVNPTGTACLGPYALEVCDPVSHTPWVVKGPRPDYHHLWLSNFVYPSYYGYLAGALRGKPRYPYDHLGVLTEPGHPEAGAYQTVNGDLVAGPRLPALTIWDRGYHE